MLRPAPTASFFIFFPAQLLDDDGSHSEETSVPPPRVRPKLSAQEFDDVKDMRIQRPIGDAVELWYSDGWWEGFVIDVSPPDKQAIKVFFEASKEMFKVALMRTKGKEALRVK